MKMTYYSLVAIYVAVFATVDTPCALIGSDALSLGDPLLAQAATSSSKARGVKSPKFNGDQNGVILKGYDPVAYFKQKKAVKGDPKYSSLTEERLTISRLRMTKARSTKLPRNMSHNMAVIAPTQ